MFCGGPAGRWSHHRSAALRRAGLEHQNDAAVHPKTDAANAAVPANKKFDGPERSCRWAFEKGTASLKPNLFALTLSSQAAASDSVLNCPSKPGSSRLLRRGIGFPQCCTNGLTAEDASNDLNNNRNDRFHADPFPAEQNMIVPAVNIAGRLT
jgi:hypothetical protein